MSEVFARDGERPPVEVSGPPLQVDMGMISQRERAQDKGSSEEGRPCIYRYLAFAPFAQAWIAWRTRRGEPCSATYLAERMGVSRTLANDLCRGAAGLLPQHVPGAIRAFNLDLDEGAYLEGLARLALATDREDRARELQALTLFEANRSADAFRGGGGPRHQR